MKRGSSAGRSCLALVAAFAIGLASTPALSAAPASAPTLMKAPDAYARMTEDQVRETEAYTLGVQAVLWGMQWVKAGEAFRMFTQPLPEGATRSPFDSNPRAINVWGHAQELLTSDFRTIETPNTETLYSMALLDLEEGPIVVVHPDFSERYFRTTVWDLHSDTHTISQKQDGSKPPPYAIVRAGWKGELPAGMKSIEVRSRYALLAPHIAVYGKADLPNVHAIQKGLEVIALKDWGKSNARLRAGAPMRPIRRPDTQTPQELMFFEELGETLKDISVREDELGFARQLEAIGLTSHEGFQYGKLDAATIAGLRRASLDGQTLASHKARAMSPLQPGGTWAVGDDLTSLDDWYQRAGVGYGYVWGDLDSEVLYPMVRVDSAGQPLSGENNYVLHFPAGQLPPARYWRISMYDLEGFFVGNAANRFGIGNMAEKLEPDRDGGLTIRIQHDSPGKGRETNWLPAPAEGFFLVMRLYQPEERMYRGEYIVPPLRKID